VVYLAVILCLRYFERLLLDDFAGRCAVFIINQTFYLAGSLFIIAASQWMDFLRSLAVVIYAIVLSCRRELTPKAVLIFAGTVFLGLAVLIFVVTTACLLPYVTLYGCCDP
jgi:hypothetical protein